jgi:hypothetical protein
MNFGLSEVGIVAGATLASTAFGYMAGKGIYKMAVPSAAMGGLIGLSGGTGLAMQNSWGTSPNPLLPLTLLVQLRVDPDHDSSLSPTRCRASDGLLPQRRGGGQVHPD